VYNSEGLSIGMS